MLIFYYVRYANSQQTTSYDYKVYMFSVID